MTEVNEQLEAEIRDQKQVVNGLQVAVFAQHDPSGDDAMLDRLDDALKKLAELETRRQAAPSEKPKKKTTAAKGAGNFLAAGDVQVEVTICMDPLPTGAYHLMDEETDPLVKVSLNTKVSGDRVRVRAFIEGLSAEAVRTVKIDRHGVEVPLQPTLLPQQALAIHEIQRASLHVIVDHLDDKKLVCHETFQITCLARNASFNAVRRRDTGETIDLSHYYGAWVTPHAEAVQDRIRRAVELAPNKQVMGYQGDADGVPQQVQALYESLRESEIVYVNSVIDYGAPAGMTTQRTRLPRESLRSRSANCIDGTVLLASLLEGASLNPAIVLVPGHAIVGWEVWPDSDEWRYLETTMIGSSDFQTACESAEKLVSRFEKFSANKIKRHSLRDLRSRGIWPME